MNHALTLPRKSVRMALAALAGLIALSTCLHAAEPLSFQSLRGERIVRTDLPALNFKSLGETQKDSLAIQARGAALNFAVLVNGQRTASPLPRKTVVYVFCLDSRMCPPCGRIEGEVNALSPEDRKKLPIDPRIEKNAPDWVQSFPTFYWQDPDGKWLQYTLENESTDAGMLKAFVGVLERNSKKTL